MAKKQKRKVEKAAKRRLLIFGTISFALIVYFFVTLSTYTIRIMELSAQKKELSNQIITLKDDEENLKLEIQKLQDPDYIARFARENYLYSKDGEYIIKIEDKKKDNKNTTTKIVVKEEYIAVGGVAVFLLLVLWLRRKQK